MGGSPLPFLSSPGQQSTLEQQTWYQIISVLDLYLDKHLLTLGNLQDPLDS